MIKKSMLYIIRLQSYESMGIKIKKIHRTISFDEEPWLKPYIDNNTENRKKKLLVISKKIYGS